jgi:hypothetical protein
MRKLFALVLVFPLLVTGCAKPTNQETCQVTCDKDLNGGCTCGTCLCTCCDPTEIE